MMMGIVSLNKCWSTDTYQVTWLQMEHKIIHVSVQAYVLSLGGNHCIEIIIHVYQD